MSGLVVFGLIISVVMLVVLILFVTDEKNQIDRIVCLGEDNITLNNFDNDVRLAVLENDRANGEPTGENEEVYLTRDWKSK